jgi:DNA-binding MarR family transcriptional regulator
MSNEQTFAGHDADALRTAFDVMETLRSARDNMSVQLAQSLILVALNEGSSLRDLQLKTQWSMSTMSRHLLDLGERNRHMEPGLDLVVMRQNPMELRRNEYRLTKKGRTLLARVIQLLERYRERR